MKYATWILNFSSSNEGTGPEASIAKQGFSAEGIYSNGDITNGGKIFGYFTGTPSNLQEWNFVELSQEQALDFVLALDASAYVAEDGKIQVQIKEDN
jgi:hypothetical protein